MLVGRIGAVDWPWPTTALWHTMRRAGDVAPSVRRPGESSRSLDGQPLVRTMPAHRFQILALDVDGTLLDPDGTLRPRTQAAVARAAKAGIRPVLCTGRRYRRAWPISCAS